MTIKWTGFPSAIDATSSDVLVGLAGGTTNARFNATSFLFAADDLSDVANAVTAFNNISPLTTAGDLLTFNGTNNIRVAIGTTDQIMSVVLGTPTWIDNPGLLIANNLSDLDNLSDALDNLGLNTTDDVTFNSITAATTVTGATVTTTGFFQNSAANALTANPGGGQASALALTKGVNRITTVATAGDSVKLPQALAGRQVVVINAAASNAMDNFPASGDAINALAADTAISIVANTTVMFFCAVNGIWNSIVTA